MYLKCDNCSMAYPACYQSSSKILQMIDIITGITITQPNAIHYRGVIDTHQVDHSS